MKAYFIYFLCRLFFSPYRSVYFLFIYILILYLINWSVSDCMNNGSEVPLIAEAKPELSQQSMSIKRSVVEYAGDIERLENKIVEQEKIIKDQQETISSLAQTVGQQWGELRNLDWEASEASDRALEFEAEVRRYRDHR